VLLHVGVQDDEDDGGDRQSQNDEGQDEEGGLLARFLGRLRDPERIDEGVGEEVYEAHASIMLRSCWRWNFESRLQLPHLYG